MKPLADIRWTKPAADQASHHDAATFQFAYEAWEKFFDGCFNLSVLLLLLMVSAMMLLLLTRIAALVTVVLLTMMLLPMVSTVARPISTTILMRELWWHLRRATLKINIYSACVALRGILQSHLPADLLDAWLDLLDMIGRMISFSYNTIGPKKRGSALYSVSSLLNPSGSTYTCRWVCPWDWAYFMRASRISSASSTNWPCKSIVSPATRSSALFSLKM